MLNELKNTQTNSEILLSKKKNPIAVYCTSTVLHWLMQNTLRETQAKFDGFCIVSGSYGGLIRLWEFTPSTGGYSLRKTGEAARRFVDDLYQE